MNNFYEFLKYANSRLEYLDSLDSYIEKVAAPIKQTKGGGGALGSGITSSLPTNFKAKAGEGFGFHVPQSNASGTTTFTPIITPTKQVPTPTNPKVDPAKPVPTPAKTVPETKKGPVPEPGPAKPEVEGSGNAQRNIGGYLAAGAGTAALTAPVVWSMASQPGENQVVTAKALSDNAQLLDEAQRANKDYKEQLAHYENMNILERLLFLIFGSEYQSYYILVV